MEVKAKLNNLRVSPRKVRLVADLIRGLSVDAAKVQLNFLTKKSSNPLLKLLNSAIANAKNNFKLEGDNLFISEIFVNEGPTFKRIMPRAMGRAFHIRKRTSHINITLSERGKEGDKADSNQAKTDKTKASSKVLPRTRSVKKEIEKIEKKENIAAKPMPDKAESKKPAVKEAKREDVKKEEDKKPDVDAKKERGKQAIRDVKAHRGAKKVSGLGKRAFKKHE